VDLDGRPVRVHVAATRPREAVDLLVERLDHRLERMRRPFRRVRPTTGRGPDPADPEVVRHAPVSARCCSVDDAIAELRGFDFHLFTDVVSGQDAVVYRAGPTGLRLALAGGDTRGPYSASVTVSPQPAPVLDADDAVRRMTLTGLPFVFYVDAGHGRGALLYRGHDGRVGLVDQARARR
jgi:Sigma 54 modulation/S30EA ribosomal protein C terminus